MNRNRLRNPGTPSQELEVDERLRFNIRDPEKVVTDIKEQFIIDLKEQAGMCLDVGFSHDIKADYVDNVPSLRGLTISCIVNSQDDEVEVTLRLTDDANASLEQSSIITGDEREITIKARLSLWSKELIHDYVFSILNDDNDQALSVIEEPDSGEIECTPDMVLEDLDRCYIVEFATRASANPNLNILAARDKISRYIIPVERRVRKRQRRTPNYKAFLSAIVVSSTSVCSNVVLREAIKKELVLRKRVSDVISAKMAELGYRTTAEECTEDIRGISTMLDSIGENFGTDEDQVTKEDYKTMFSPPDIINLQKIINKSVLNAMNLIKSGNNDEEENLYMAAVMSGERREHNKRVINYPIFNANYLPGIDIRFRACTDDNSPMERLVTKCFKNLKTSEENLEELLVRADLPFVVSKDMEEESKPHRHKFNRSKITLDEADWQSLAMIGLEAKRFEGETFLESVKEKKKALSYECPTDDIDHDIGRGFEWLSEPSGILDPSSDQVLGLMGSAISLHGLHPTASTKFLDNLIRTKGFSFCRLISAIGTELAISITQHTHRHEFLVKKVRDYDVYLIIKPTRSASHIFYSIVVPEDSIHLSDFQSSRNFFYSGNCFYTEMISVDTSRMNNMVTLASAFIVIVIDTMRWSKTEMHEDFFISEIKDTLTREHIVFRLLVRMENKRNTEESITNWRYVLMNLLPVHVYDNRPWKAFNKHNVIFRSRLEIWIQKKQLTALRIMMRDRPKMKKTVESEIDESKDNCVNLVDYVTGQNLSTLSSCIETFYEGYEVDKNNSSWANSDGALIVKILEEELKYGNTRTKFHGESDHTEDDPRPHEFSISMVKSMADSVCSSLNSSLGPLWRSQLSQSIKYELSQITHSDLATLKATSNLSPEDFKATTKTTLPRSKMAEKVLENLNEKESNSKWCVYNEIPGKLQEIESIDAILVDLFPKPQHGGKREIYVMHNSPRYCQAFLERISKVICSHLPSETMSNPKRKISIPANHYAQSKQMLLDGAEMLYSSDDKTRWNQRLVVKSFTILLCRILPTEFHNFIIRLLNMWTKKRILLPGGVQTQLMNPDIEIKDEIRTLLTRCFQGRENNTILHKGERVMRIRTGMMQGILHFTSSLFHAAFLLFHQSIMNKVIRDINPNYSVIINHMVSSDDSSSLVTAKGEDRAISTNLALVCLETVGTMSKYVSLFDSVKSAKGLKDIVEFNSIWNIQGSIVKPIIKWACAALVIPTCASLVSRQEHFSNINTQIIEAGGPIREAMIVQQAQCFLHYQLIGSLTNGLFPIYVRRISRSTDPNAGFFFLDHPIMAGLMGHDYNNYVALTNNDIYNCLTANQLKGDYIEITPTGSISTAGVIRYGSLKKYHRFRESCEPYFDWRQSIEDNPEMLYRKPKTVEEEICHIMRKLTSSNVGDTFNNGLAPVKSIAASVYLLSFHSLTRRMARCIMKEDDPDESLRKYSLLEMSNIQENGPLRLTEENLSWIFPAIHNYKRIKDTAHYLYHNSIEFKWITTMKSTTTITIPKSESSSYSDMLTLCRWKWFRFNVPLHYGTLEMNWAKVKGNIKWIKDTANSSRDEGPFINHCELHDFITQSGCKERKVHLTSAPLRGLNHQATIPQFICRDQWPGILLRYGREEMVKAGLGRKLISKEIKEYESTKVKLENAANKLFLLSLLPLTENKWEEMAEDIIKNEATPVSYEELSSYPQKLAALGMLCSVARGESHDEAGVRHLSLSYLKGAVVGGYTVRQKRGTDGKYKGVGTWLGKIDGIKTRINVLNGNLSGIETEDPTSLCVRSKRLIEFLVDIGIDPASKERVPGKSYVFDGKEIKYSLNDCAGVRVVKTELPDLIVGTPGELKLGFSKEFKCVRAVTEYLDLSEQCSSRSSKRRRSQQEEVRPKNVTVMSYTPTIQDLRVNVRRKEGTGGLIDSWVNQTPVDQYKFWGFIKNVREDISKGGTRISETFMIDKLRLWLNKVLTKALRTRGLIQETILMTDFLLEFQDQQGKEEVEQDQEEEEDVEMHPAMPGRGAMLKFDVNEMREGIKSMNALLQELVEMEDDEEEYAGMDVFKMREAFEYKPNANRRNAIDPVCEIHPLLNSVVSSGDVSQEWWKKVAKGEKCLSSLEWSECALWVLGTLRKKPDPIDLGSDTWE